MITLGSETQLRYDTLENWIKENPILAKGEMVVVTENSSVFLKCGNGENSFNELPYVNFK